MRYATSIPCSYCGEPAGSECTTAAGNPKAYGPHNARWDALKSAYRSREMLFRLKHDDPHFGLNEGDELVCVSYPYDDKVTVLYRKSDGFNPGCNQYTGSAEFMGWML
jgi:hypothetical protein